MIQVYEQKIKQLKKDLWNFMNKSLFGTLCKTLLNFCPAKFLHDEEQIMKSVSKPKYINVTR